MVSEGLSLVVHQLLQAKEQTSWLYIQYIYIYIWGSPGRFLIYRMDLKSGFERMVFRVATPTIGVCRMDHGSVSAKTRTPSLFLKVMYLLCFWVPSDSWVSLGLDSWPTHKLHNTLFALGQTERTFSEAGKEETSAGPNDMWNSPGFAQKGRD